jgi:hypothetical protein
MFFLESTRENYGKRGMSVHGSAVTYTRTDGTKAVRHYHAAVDGDSTQDAGATLSIFEVLCYNIQRDFPNHTVEIGLQTDNAANYASLLFILHLQSIAAQYGLVSFVANRVQLG